MKKNMVHAFAGNLVILVMNEHTPADEEHAALMRAIVKQDISKLRNLTITAGGSPSAAQRKIVNDTLKGAEMPAAIITNSQITRGVVTAMGWFNSKVKAFAPEKLDEALRYLEVASSDWERVRILITKLQLELGTSTINAATLR